MEQSVETLFGATGENPVLPAVSPQIATRWMLEGCCHRIGWLGARNSHKTYGDVTSDVRIWRKATLWICESVTLLLSSFSIQHTQLGSFLRSKQLQSQSDVTGRMGIGFGYSDVPMAELFRLLNDDLSRIYPEYALAWVLFRHISEIEPAQQVTVPQDDTKYHLQKASAEEISDAIHVHQNPTSPDAPGRPYCVGVNESTRWVRLVM